MRARLPLIFLCWTSCIIAAEQSNSSAISLNPAAVQFAHELIRKRHFIADNKGAWQRDKPSSARENEFIRARGFEEYAKWHLGVDNRRSPRSKSHYKFPFGDFNAVHRCGLLAVKSRAHEYGYADIEAAADQLLAEIENQTAQALRNASINSGKSLL